MIRPLALPFAVLSAALLSPSGLHAQTVRLGVSDVPLAYGGQGITLDLNADGQPDARLIGGEPCGGCGETVYLTAIGSAAQFRTRPQHGLQCDAVGPGFIINQDSGPWSSLAALGGRCGSIYAEGFWCAPFEGYVAYRVNGPVPTFGWLRISNSNGFLSGFVLREGAFNAAGAPIFAGEGSIYALPPQFSVPGGEYNDYLSVALSALNPGAEIRYTTDGSTPGPQSPILAPGQAIQVTQTGTVIRAYATRAGLLDSPIAEAGYTLVASTPEFDPPSGAPPLAVTVTSATSDAAIYYTLDGSSPEESTGVRYTGPVAITAETRLRARAFKPGLEPSRIADRVFATPGIIYADPDDLPIHPGQRRDLDLDGDGRIDLSLALDANGSIRAPESWVVGEDYGNAVLVSRLARGATVSSETWFIYDAFCYFGGCTAYLCDRTSGWGGDWCDASQEGYLGAVTFSADWSARYAWVRFRTPAGPGEPAAVLDWAYQNQAETPIIAGDSGGPLCPPVILTQPANATVSRDTPVTLSVGAATGTARARYQWRRNGVPIDDDGRITGARSASLRIASPATGDAGVYDCVIGAEGCADAVVSAGATLDVVDPCPAVGGRALSLDGLGAHARLPAGVYFDGDHTVEAWVRVHDYRFCMRLLEVSNGPASDNVAFGLSFNTTGRPVMQTARGANANFLAVVADEPLPIGQWAHVAFVTQGGTGRIYINGRLAATGPMDMPRSVTRTQNHVGKSVYAQDGFTPAEIDELRLWTVARSGAQVREALSQRIDPGTPGLLALYRFDEPDGAAADLTGHGRNAPLLAGATRAIVTGLCCPADLNGDGALDPDDLADAIACYFSNPTCPEADRDGSGTVDPDDLADAIAAYFAGCP